jgi:hypothetical protein
VPSIRILVTPWNGPLLLVSVALEVGGLVTGDGDMQGAGGLGLLVAYLWGYVMARRHPDEPSP